MSFATGGFGREAHAAPVQPAPVQSAPGQPGPQAKPTSTPVRRVPLPQPRPAELDDEVEAEAGSESVAPAPQAGGWGGWGQPATFAAPPADAPSAAPEAAAQPESAPSAAPAPAGRVKMAALPKGAVPLPEPRPPEADGAEDVETDEGAAPMLVPPPPAVGSGAPPRFPPRSTPGAPTEPVPGEHLGVAGLPPACAALVDAQVILAVRAAPVPERPGCSLPAPVRMSGVRLKDGSFVRLTPAATVRCETAIAVADWVREDLADAAATLGSRLEAVKVASSYDCRPRNRVRGAKMSQHGMGNAFDLGGLVLDDLRVLDVKGGGLPTALQTVMKDSACARFTTVLGPGSDGYHEDHVHVDLEQRRLDVRLCRWRIREQGPVIAHATPTPAAPSAAAPAAGAEDDAGEADGMPTNVPLPVRRPRI